MDAVKQGADRQEMHEVIRRASMEATARMKQGEPCALPALLGADPAFPFGEEEILSRLRAEDYTGRCAEQTEALVQTIRPMLEEAPADEVSIEV